MCFLTVRQNHGSDTVSILDSVVYVLFTFPDETHLVVRTSLNITLVPKMDEGCVFDLDWGVNIPIAELEEASKEILEDCPEQFKEESDFYKKVRYGVPKI
jgi:hypothetical protein